MVASGPGISVCSAHLYVAAALLDRATGARIVGHDLSVIPLAPMAQGESNKRKQ
jgi:hypothetical protein